MSRFRVCGWNGAVSVHASEREAILRDAVPFIEQHAIREFVNDMIHDDVHLRNPLYLVSPLVEAVRVGGMIHERPPFAMARGPLDDGRERCHGPVLVFRKRLGEAKPEGARGGKAHAPRIPSASVTVNPPLVRSALTGEVGWR